MTDELSRLDATAQATLVRSGEASPAELVAAQLEAAQPWADRRPPVHA